MSLKNSIFLDFSLDQKYIFVFKENKFYKKKIVSLKRSENIGSIFFDFIKKNKIEIDDTYFIFINLGPGNLIAIRNCIVFAKMLSLFFGCSLMGFSHYQILRLNNKKVRKALITLGDKTLLLDLLKKSVKKVSKVEISKFRYPKYKIVYNKEILKNLVLSNNFKKKSFSNILF